MLSPLRNRFGIPGVISVIALVFAMMGGAYAASSNSGGKATASAKAKKGPRGPKGPAGPSGPTGPAGPAGPAAKGDTGAKGDKGDPGTPGKDGKNILAGSFTGDAEPEGEPCNEAGGSEFEVEGSGNAEYVCNGAGGGGGGFPAVLPPGATETGAWASMVEGEEFTAASFAIPLEEAPAETAIVPVAGPVPANCDDGEGEAPSAENPEADPGVFCVFVGATFGGQVEGINTPQNGSGSGRTGAVIYSVDAVMGTWAVTAEE